jgi:hypothetical protein
MSRHNPEELARFWDDLAAGQDLDSEAIDPTLAEAVRRLHTAQDVGGADPAFTKRLLEELMHAPASALPGDGVARAAWGPAVRATSPSRKRPVRAYLQFAMAAMLLVSLGIGYLAFQPFGSGDDGPSSIPAAVAPLATPGTPQLSPTAAISRVGHPIIGVWRLDVEPYNPGFNISYGIFNEDGTYVAYHEVPGVSIGTWQPTGERTVELAFVVQRPVPQDLFDPNHVPVANELESTYFEVWRLELTLDESGTTMTSVGSLDAFDAEGGRIWGWDGGDQRWIRLILDPTVEVTPAP